MVVRKGSGQCQGAEESDDGQWAEADSIGSGQREVVVGETVGRGRRQRAVVASGGGEKRVSLGTGQWRQAKARGSGQGLLSEDSGCGKRTVTVDRIQWWWTDVEGRRRGDEQRQ